MNDNAFSKEPMLFFLKADAEVYGVDGAIMIYNIRHWCAVNKSHDRNFFDGHYWTYHSIKSFQEQFPFWTKGKIERILENLVKAGCVLKGNYNKSSYDRTCWYAVVDNENSISQNQELHFPKTGNGFPENRKPIPDNNTDNKRTDNKQERTLSCSKDFSCGDILGERRPTKGSEIKDPTTKTTPEDVRLVNVDLDDIQVGDWERLVNWFEYNRRYKNKVIKPYCKREFKQVVEMLRTLTGDNWFYAVDALEYAVERCYHGFGNAKDGLFYGLKSKEDYDLEMSLAKDYRTRPQDMPERIMRYKPIVLDLALDYCNEQIAQLQGRKSEEKAGMDGLDPQNPSYERLRGYASEKIANYDREITEYVNKIKWCEDEKNALKAKKTC